MLEFLFMSKGTRIHSLVKLLLPKDNDLNRPIHQFTHDEIFKNRVLCWGKFIDEKQFVIYY